MKQSQTMDADRQDGVSMLWGTRVVLAHLYNINIHR